ncbi:MAG: c-type cytochrome [Lewinellaceae bacterium]|nr:c-type cytochrome [Lewinellaceae bacterium]
MTGILLFMFCLAQGFMVPVGVKWTPKTPVYEVLRVFGEPMPAHYLSPSEEQIARGEAIVKHGWAISPTGKKGTAVSKYYVCTTCHNLKQEDPDLRVSNPDTRLPYVKAKGIPFLQGTTFKGIVNRTSWYNDDYVKKYGAEKIGKAHHDLREAIQLCAIECSQGRPMEDWEEDAVLAYFWSLQFTLGDLGLTDENIRQLEQLAAAGDTTQATRQLLQDRYMPYSPAHFYDAPPNKKAGYEGITGNPAVGKDIYTLSCLHCHQTGGVSHYILGMDPLSFEHLRNNITKDSHFSLYQIIAYGTYAIPGHRPYMPHYPAERMSKQQVEDLRAFVEQETDLK